MKHKTTRIIGYDIARLIAIFGMIIVNFKYVIGHNGSPVLQSVATFFEGKAAATFVVLAGVGMSLMVRKSVENNDSNKLRNIKQLLIKRAAFLFAIGLLFFFLWPADILHYYGLYLLIGVALLTIRSKYLLLISGGIIFISPLLFLFLDYEQNWNFDLLQYHNFWTAKGFLLNLFFNGFHPVFPWVSFLIYGLWLGRINLSNIIIRKKIILTSFTIFISIQLISYSGRIYFPGNEFVSTFINTKSMPPFPLYLINGMAIATFIISCSIALGEQFKSSRFFILLSKTGQYAFTIYITHVVIGIFIPLLLSDGEVNMYRISFTFIYAFIFFLCSIWFVKSWSKAFERGPLELFMRKISG